MKRIKIFTATLAVMFSAFVAAAQTAQDVADKYTKAAALINDKKDYAAAAPLIEQVIAEGTKVGADAANNVANAKKLLPSLYYSMGLATAKNKDFAAAETNFTKAYNKAREYKDLTWQKRSEEMLANIYIAQAGVFVKSKDYTKAAEIYQKGMNALPSNTTLQMYLAISYVEGGRKDEGFAILKQLAAKGGKTGDSAKAKMEYYENVEANKALTAKNYPKAISLLNETLKNNPKNATAQMMLIQAYNNSKSYDNVISKGPAALAAQTDAKQACDIYYMIGQAYENKNNNAKAIENYKKVTSGNSVSLAKERITELSK